MPTTHVESDTATHGTKRRKLCSKDDDKAIEDGNLPIAPGALGLLRTMEGSLNDIRDIISCRICVHSMYEPYITECGHTFCYGCLVRWFEQDRTKKSCPDCRAPVSKQPVPSFAVRMPQHLMLQTQSYHISFYS